MVVYNSKMCSSCSYLLSQCAVWMFQLSRNTLKLVASWKYKSLLIITLPIHSEGEKNQRNSNWTDLYIHDPEVGNEIPSRQTITVVAIKSKSCCVIDGISYLERQHECQDTHIRNNKCYETQNTQHPVCFYLCRCKVL